MSKLRSMALCLLGLVAATSLVACGGSGSSGSSGSAGGKGAEKKTYSVVLSNGFVGNDWRVQMQHAPVVLTKKAPLKDSVSSMKVFTTQNNDVGQQNAALQTAIEEKPDILLIDASSATAQNGILQRACSAGITVVTFDVLATAPCAWKLSPDFRKIGAARAEWVARTIGGRGDVIVDWGISGLSATEDQGKAAMAVLAKYPGIKAYKYYSQVTPGGETSAVTQMVAAHPNIKGIVAQGYGAYALRAAVRAGTRPLPTAGWAYNISLETCQQYRAPCMFVSLPAWISAEALRLGIRVRDGEIKGSPRLINFATPVFVSNNVAFDASSLGPVSALDRAIDPNAPGGVFVPVSPPWARLSTAEAVG